MHYLCVLIAALRITDATRLLSSLSISRFEVDPSTALYFSMLIITTLAIESRSKRTVSFYLLDRNVSNVSMNIYPFSSDSAINTFYLKGFFHTFRVPSRPDSIVKLIFSN